MSFNEQGKMTNRHKAEPTIGEEWRALLGEAPGMTLVFVTSFAFAICRFVYVVGIHQSKSFIEAVGLFSPWFAPWALMLVTGSIISLKADAIDKRAKGLAAKRQSYMYSQRH